MREAMKRKKLGMANLEGHASLLRCPPRGGFARVRCARRNSNKGPSAMAIFLTAFGAFSLGMYLVGQGINT